MKNLISILICLFAFVWIAHSQLSDTTCIKSRWISLKPNERNSKIFQVDSLKGKDHDMIHTIKQLVESNKIHIYSKSGFLKSNVDWDYIEYQKEIEKIKNDSSAYWTHDPYFEIRVQSNRPLTNQWGEDSIRPMPDGTMVYIYPPATIYSYFSDDCELIKIKEVRIYDEQKEKYEWRPVKIGFQTHTPNGMYSYVKFWADIDEINEALEEINNYQWLKAINNRDYHGFQYMQESCYE